MASAARKTFVTPEEYLTIERLAEFKSEYHDGQIYAMAGSSFRHNKILGNIFYQLRSQLDGRDCQVTMSDIRLGTNPPDSYTYPDLMVICGEPQFSDQAFDTILNPTVIVEILAPSIEKWDRGGKFDRYREMQSLLEYILVSQAKPSVERYARGEPGEGWALTRWESREDILSIPAVGCVIPLRDIYRDVMF